MICFYRFPILLFKIENYKVQHVHKFLSLKVYRIKSLRAKQLNVKGCKDVVALRSFLFEEFESELRQVRPKDMRVLCIAPQLVKPDGGSSDGIKRAPRGAWCARPEPRETPRPRR